MSMGKSANACKRCQISNQRPLFQGTHLRGGLERFSTGADPASGCADPVSINAELAWQSRGSGVGACPGTKARKGWACTFMERPA